LRDAPFSPFPEAAQTNCLTRLDSGSLPPQANALEYLPWTRPTMSACDKVYFVVNFRFERDTSR
jgi:hypothetical protein